ncbi:hypothetical protein ACIHFC_28855 [Streptomyces sp. NPDC052013]|uniref:hypothetical protein n=1 Tax=Streptomyces sp. NPDC052013 TaxID=3365679 RepID=UPI0037D49E43
MRIRYAVAVALLTGALTACSSKDSTSDSSDTEAKPKASATEQELSQQQKDDISKAAGMPPKPTGQERQELLDALAAAAPDVVRYEDEAVDAARNQCSAINGEGVKRIDWLASQRFTYKDVTTTEEQGAKINQALKDTGFCNV